MASNIDHGNCEGFSPQMNPSTPPLPGPSPGPPPGRPKKSGPGAAVPTRPNCFFGLRPPPSICASCPPQTKTKTGRGLSAPGYLIILYLQRIVHLNEDKPIVKLQHRTSADSEDGTAIMMATLSVSSNGMYIVHAESVGDLSFGILHRLYPKQTTCTKDNAFCVL